MDQAERELRDREHAALDNPASLQHASRSLLHDPPAFVTDRRLAVPANWLEEAFARLLWMAEGEEASREDLLDTPHRAARAWLELMRGYRMSADLKTFPANGYDEIVAVSGLAFYSTCEHHGLSFNGTADFAYVPDERIVGLSKFARLLEVYSCRLQLQERLTQQMADELEAQLRPRGVIVVVRAEHLCMACRGPKAPGHQTTTSVVRGLMKDDPKARAEALELLR